MNQEQFEVAIIDADSLIYQIAYVQTSPALCKKAFDTALGDIMSATEAQTGAVFIKGKDNFRYKVAADYKGNRQDTIEPEVKDRIVMLYDYAKDFCIESDGAEADDYCGVAAKLAKEEDKSFVICHIDKDLNSLPGWHYNFKKKEFYDVDPNAGYLFMMKQMLTGDSTDNIQGIRGLGPKTADKLLDQINYDQIFNKVIEVWESKQGSSWKDNFVRCANLIYIRESSQDFQPLAYEELKERFTWKPTMAIGTPLVNDQPEPLDSSTTSKTSKQEDDTLEESN